MSHIANMIAVIKSGIKGHKMTVSHKKGPKFLIDFVKVFYSEGLIQKYVVVSKKPILDIEIYLKPRVIKDIRIISCPGRKVYASAYKLKSAAYLNSRIVYILSTSYYGIISSNEAIAKNVGGELLCQITHI